MLKTKTKKATKRKPKAGPSPATIKRRLAELRLLIDTTKDPYEARIAYAMETAIVWATEHTVDWYPPAKEAVVYAEILRKDLLLDKSNK